MSDSGRSQQPADSNQIHPVDEGTVLPELTRRVTQVDMIAYAGATWDWHRLHYDWEYLESKQMPAPVIDGQMFGALLAEHACRTLGATARPVAMSFRFLEMLFAGALVTVTGTVTSIEHVGDERHITVTQQLVGDDQTVAIRDANTIVKARTQEHTPAK